MKIIINADDFGINKIVTSRIEQLIEEGFVTSTTVMANGECLEEMKRFALCHPNVSYGVHLCLSEFSSVTKSSVLQKYGLTDENGSFIRKAIFSMGLIDDELLSAIKNELRAQINIIKQMGIPISHADSHHHVHTIPELVDVFTEVLLENGISKVRLSQVSHSLRTLVHPELFLRSRMVNVKYRKHFKTTQVFFPFSEYCNFLKKKIHINYKTIELMCHPGHPSEKYMSEIELMHTHPLLTERKNILFNYNELN